jgi:hypothetical protein
MNEPAKMYHWRLKIIYRGIIYNDSPDNNRFALFKIGAEIIYCRSKMVPDSVR